MIEDKLLIRKSKNGSGDALSRIYKKYRNDLLRIAFALLNDTTAAEDIVHDCFVSFAQSGARLSIDGNLKSYLAKCVANRVRNANVARQRKETAGPDEVGSGVSNSERPEQNYGTR
jgi:DNA-directed RNA polymerase specialized sigma24 family protein